MGLIVSFCQRMFRSLRCCYIRGKPKHVSYSEIVLNSWSDDDIYRVADIRERYPQVVGGKATCRVCLKIRRIDMEFFGHQVRNLVHPKRNSSRKFMGLLCMYCSEIQMKEAAERKRLADEILYAQFPHLREFRESAFIQDPFARAMYDMNRGLNVDLNHYGIYSKADYD